jgi:hypothetical protein
MYFFLDQIIPPIRIRLSWQWQRYGKTEGGFLRLRSAVVWALIGVYLALVVAFAWDPKSFAQVLAAIGIASSTLHDVFYCGWKNALVLLVICLVITFTMENIGVAVRY